MKLPRFRTISENLSIKDILFSGAPTAGTYTGYLNGYLNDYLPKWLIENPAIGLALTLAIFLIVIIILYWVNNEAHKRSLAEILANSYFLNFSGKLTSLLRQGTDVAFTRSSGKWVVKPGALKLEVHLPTSKEKLRQISSAIDRETEIAYIDSNPFVEPAWWVKIKVDAANGKVTILETPRILFALPNYLSSEYTLRSSKKLHSAFNKKFTQLLEDNPDKVPPGDRFEIIQE